MSLSQSGIVVAAARVSWLLPLAAMSLVGFSEKGSGLLSLPSHGLLLVVSAASVLAIALGAAAILATSQKETGAGGRRAAFLGTGAGLILLFVSQTASIAGELSARQGQANLRAMTETAMRDYPGWNGNVPVGLGRVFITEVDGESQLAKFLLSPFDRTFLVLLVGIDNTLGDRELVLNLDGARILQATGAKRAVVSRAEMRAHVVPGHEETMAAHLGSYHLPIGARLDDALLLLTPPATMRDARGIEVHVNGASTVIPGRYFTIDEKRAIDSARAAAYRGTGR